jgi:hypothetical protein
LVLAVMGIILLGYIFRKCWSRDWRYESSDISAFFGTIFSILFSILLMILVVVPSVETIVKVKVAPRVYIIEWVADKVSHKNPTYEK